jgi:hypothetical protein
MEYFGVRDFGLARKRLKNWSGRRGSNPRPTAWKAVTLPLSYSRNPLQSTICKHSFSVLAPMALFVSLSSEAGFQQVHRLPSAFQR